MIIGIMLVVIGLMFFAQALGFITSENMSILWPVLLIILGVALISHKKFGHQCSGPNCCGGTVAWPNGKGTKKRRK